MRDGGGLLILPVPQPARSMELSISPISVKFHRSSLQPVMESHVWTSATNLRVLGQPSHYVSRLNAFSMRTKGSGSGEKMMKKNAQVLLKLCRYKSTWFSGTVLKECSRSEIGFPLVQVGLPRWTSC